MTSWTFGQRTEGNIELHKKKTQLNSSLYYLGRNILFSNSKYKLEKGPDNVHIGFDKR